MKTWVSISLSALVGSIAVTGVWIWFFGFQLLAPILCRNHVISEATSGDGSQHVVVFDRACGPPAEHYTIVHVVRGRESLYDRDGEVFVTDADPASAAEPRVSTRWDSPNNLVVRYPETARVYFSVTKLVELAIRYETYK
jgi:hypothetical protein